MFGSAPLLITVAGILWGCLGIFVRHLNVYGFNALDIVLIRVAIPTLILAVYMFFAQRNSFRIRLSDLWCFIGTGLCSLTFFNFCYFHAIAMTDLSVAAVLLYTAPAFVMIMSWTLFREKMNGRKVFSLVMTFAGCVLVTGAADTFLSGAVPNVTGMGILFGIGAGFGYALYSIFSRYAIQRGYSSLTITFYTFLIAFVSSLFLTNPLRVLHLAADQPACIFWVIGIGIFSTIVPYLTYTLGLRSMENGKASIIASIEPVTATILGVLVYHESMSLLSCLGVVLVLGAILICNIPARDKNS